jgi:transposase
VVTDRDRSVVAWVAVIGAASAQDVMDGFGVGRNVGYRGLARLVDHGLLARPRLVHGQPALYTATREGLAWAGLSQLDPARVGVATTRHWALCARLAMQLERAERCEVWGEPRLHAAERDAGVAIATARLGDLPDGRARRRRPDLVLFPDAALPVAVEVELSVKAARRLEAICWAWARCRLVSEVRYYAPPHVARAVPRAVSVARARRDPNPVPGRRLEGDRRCPLRRLTRWSSCSPAWRSRSASPA